MMLKRLKIKILANFSKNTIRKLWIFVIYLSLRYKVGFITFIFYALKWHFLIFEPFEGCSAVSDSNGNYKMTFKLEKCGTTLTQEEGKLIFANRVE